MQNDNILENTLPCGVFLYAGWNCAGSGYLYKRSEGHHGREDKFFGAFTKDCHLTVVRVHSKVSLNVFSSSEVGVRQLSMELILRRACA
jgi:hypothetical protein